MKKASIVALFVVLGLLATLLVIHTVFGRDIGPPDVSDLAVIRREVADEENAFTYLSQVTNIYCGEYRIHELLDALEEGSLEKKDLSDVMRSNKSNFAWIDRALMCEVCQVPEITSFTSSVSYVSGQRDIARLMDLKAGWELMRGHEEEAVETAITNLRLGFMMQDSGGAVINYLVALAVRGIALARIESIVREDKLSSRELRKYAREIALYGSAQPGFANALRAEYVGYDSAINSIQSGEDSWFGMGETATLEAVARGSRYVFQPNRTKLIFATMSRQLVRSAPRTYAEVEWPPNYWDRERGVFGVLGQVLRPNAVGMMLLGIMEPAHDAYFDRRYRSTLHARSVRILMALRACELDEKSLPESLAGLVPKYIDEVPADPYDGKPIRYSKELRLIYSVGRDCEDSGGILDAERDGHKNQWQQRDIVFELVKP